MTLVDLVFPFASASRVGTVGIYNHGSGSAESGPTKMHHVAGCSRRRRSRTSAPMATAAAAVAKAGGNCLVLFVGHCLDVRSASFVLIAHHSVVAIMPVPACTCGTVTVPTVRPR